MSSRSPSGVASLRARFEQHGENTSPPSRGRSPAGSVTSNSSRPLSKVRTSFVAVEPSGHMASELRSKGLDGVSEAVTEENTEKPKTTGNGVLPQDAANPTINVTGDQGSADSKLEKAIGDATSANPDKQVSTAQDDASTILPADPKDEEVVSGGAALAEKTPELGSILKGSPFEEKESKKASTSKASKPAAASSQHLKAPNKAPNAGPVNGRPKDAPQAKPAPTQPPKAQEKTPIIANATTKAKEAPKPATELKPLSESKPIAEAKPKAAPLAPIETQPATPSAPLAAPESSETKQENTTPPAPRTPTSATASGSQPRSKAASPAKAESAKPGEPKKDLAKEVKKPASRPLAASKAPTSAAFKPPPMSTTSTAKTVKKPGTTSPAFMKPKPKSPTRPVRLPASATAPIAAPTAKMDGAPPPAAAVTRDRTTSNSKPAVQKTPRASLPAGSKPADKPKAPKSRMSMASTQAPSGSFLERMMRPTQSSAQKTHEKVEVKSPPRKSQPLRPKRTSEGSEKSKSEQGETKGEQGYESAVKPSQPPAEASDALSTNGANESTSGAENTAPAEISTQ